ncbi:hypothetical protein ACHAXT_011370 [Thalassiosira profunda]
MANDGGVDQSAAADRLRSGIRQLEADGTALIAGEKAGHSAPCLLNPTVRGLEKVRKPLAPPGTPLPPKPWVNATTPVPTETYEGERKNGKRHGRGICRYGNGKVYGGDWKAGLRHGRGTLTNTRGGVDYNGQWKDDKAHGSGTKTWLNGDKYKGQWVRGREHGEGTLTLTDGNVYQGGFVDGRRHGWGTLMWPSGNMFEGQWVEGKRHGKGSIEFPSGCVRKQVWTNGELTRDGDDESDKGEGGDGLGDPGDDIPGQENPARVYEHERRARSQRSQQRRLQKNTETKTCEHCGVDDGQYKLRVCSGCGLGLYCSLSCQKAASGSHQRICNIVSELPARDTDRLYLKYDREKMMDLDAGLRYGTKYMDSLQHLAMDAAHLGPDDPVKLSAKKLSSLLRSKKGKLESVFWLSEYGCDSDVPGITENGFDVWRKLHGLKQLRLHNMKFDNVQHLYDIIGQQKDSLLALSLVELDIGWDVANYRKTLALAISFCTGLVKLNLDQCLLSDSDLEIMLYALPSLRSLNLERNVDYFSDQGFTDETCEIIARKCPNLQHLNLSWHNNLSILGIQKIFKGCIHLRSFHTTAHLSSKEFHSLLDIAPQLLCLSLDDEVEASDEEIDQIIEATGGRTLIQFLGIDDIHDPMNLSVSKKYIYRRQKATYRRILRKRGDPEVANEWEDMFEG